MTDFVWVGASGSYADANQWRNADTGAGPPAGPPTLVDTGTIDNGGTAVLAGMLAGLGSGLVGGTNGGMLDVNAGGVLAVGNTDTSALVVSGNAPALLNIATGGAVLFQTPLLSGNAAFSFGANSGQAGIADVLGTLDAGGNPIVVGGAGVGGVTVSGGGRINAGAPIGASALDIGELAGGAGALTVDGRGSALVANGLAEVGAQGNGSLLVQNGGAILIGNGSVGLALGVGSGAAGTLAVTSGAFATVDGPLAIGASGTGALIVQSGGTIDVGSAAGQAGATVALGPGSGGSIAVDGAGSDLNLNGGLVMGGWTGTAPGGFGGLSVTNDGSVFVRNSVLFEGAIAVDPTGTLEIGPSVSGSAAAGALTVDPSATLSGVGTIAADLVNNGLVQLVVNATSSSLINDSALVVTGNISGTGTLAIAGLSRLSADGAIGAGQTVAFEHTGAFAAVGGALELTAPGAFGGTIADMQPGDQIYLDTGTIAGGSLEGTIGGAGTLAVNGFSASVLGVESLPLTPANFSIGGPSAMLTMGVGSAGNPTAAAALARLTPASGALNEVFVAPGAALPPPIAGALNEAVVINVPMPNGFSGPQTGTLALPAGYQAGFGGGLLSDANGNSLLAGAYTIIATGSNDTLVGGGTMFAAGPGGDSITASGGTVVGGVGNDTIQTSKFYVPQEGGISFVGTAIAPGAGDDLINALGPDTIFPGGGSDTVFAYGITASNPYGGAETVGALAAVGSGTLFFVNGIGPSTIIGGNSGTDIVNAGAGGGLYGAGGGGGSVLVAGSGAATLFGVANGDVLFAGGSAADVLVAGAGNETLSGLGSSGDNALYGGSGNDLMGGGAGSETFFAGTGSDTMIAGSGSDLFAFVNGGAGGTDLIEAFNAGGGDRVTLQNYGADAVQSALGSATVAGGSTAITLPDHTTIFFQGVTNLTSAAFV